MILNLFACLVLVQTAEPIPPTPHDVVVELEITAEDGLGIEGHGPTVYAEYEVEFAGALHIWTTSELDLFLQVDDVEGLRTLASDDNSGGGTTPYLELEVKQGDLLVVLVAGDPGVTGSLTLHLIAALRTEAGRAAERAARTALREGALLASEGHRAEARELMLKAMPEVLIAFGSGHPDLLNDQMELASLMSEMGDLVNARALRESVLTARERTLPEDHYNLLAARINLGNSMLDMGEIDGARVLHESALAGFERTLPEDDPGLLGARMNMAVLLRATGDLSGARALFESVLAGFERTLPEDDPALLATGLNLATTMLDMGDLADARALYESVLAGCERTYPKDHPRLLLARLNLGVSMADMGDLAGARTLYESVLVSYERTLPEDHPDLLLVRLNLANSMSNMGDLAGARALHESVLAGYERTFPADHPALLLERVNLAATMSEMGDFASARALKESALAGYERTLPADHPSLLRAQGSLANAFFRMGDLAGARTLHEAVLAGYERTLPADHADLLHARESLAHSASEMGDLAGARELYESVLAGYERTLHADHPYLLSARLNLAVSMSEMGDLAGVRELIPKLFEGMQTRILASLALAPRQARQTVASERYRHALALSLTDSEGAELLRTVFELTETMRLVAAEASRSLSQFETDPELRPILSEAAEVRRALNDLVAGAAREHAGADGLAADLTKLSLRRDQLESEASRRLAARGVSMRPVVTEMLTAALDPGDAAVGFRRVAHWNVNEASGRREFGEDHLLAHVLTSDGTLSRIDLGPALELEELASAWRASLGAPLLRGFLLEDEADAPELETGRRLRAGILDPILELIGEDVERIFVCADDMLFLLPLDALPFEAGGTEHADHSSLDGVEANRIGDRLRIVNEVSFARLLAPKPPAEIAPSLLSLGGVDYDAQGAAPERRLGATSAPIDTGDRSGANQSGRGAAESSGEGARSTPRSGLPDRFQKLLQARYEAEATADLFEEAFEVEPALLTRKNTTKAALFESAAGKRYLHLATHGWFAPESVRSTADARTDGQSFARMGIEERVSGLAPMTLCGLALAGANSGRDSLGRVPGILTAEELCSLDLSQCELAVLSACETNVGIRRAGQGIQSLQSALYAAGARTSITSLWKVDDAATRRLMEVFYTNLWIEKMGKAESLWQAKRALRDEGHPPAHWAGWVLTGDPE